MAFKFFPWIKVWVEALDDPKMTRMSLAEQGAWWGLMMLARKCDPEGKGRLISGGEGLTVDEIAEALHIKTPGDRQALESMIEKMEKRGSLFWNDSHILTITHFEERQAIPPSSRPEAVAERVRRYRERKKKGPSRYDPQTGNIKVGRKTYAVRRAGDGTTYYFDDEGEVIEVYYDDEKPGYVPVKSWKGDEA